MARLKYGRKQMSHGRRNSVTRVKDKPGVKRSTRSKPMGLKNSPTIPSKIILKI